LDSSLDHIDFGFSTLDFSEIPTDLFLYNRKDLKYPIHINSVLEILEKLKDDYSIMINDGEYKKLYRTQYYDTEDFLFYNDHHRGILNRQKIRVRTYEDGKSFLELKRKDNKGITHKWRLEIEYAGFKIENHLSFLENMSRIKLNSLYEKLKVRYNRVTFYHKKMNEKLTFDFSYCAEYDGRIYESNSIVLVESKGVEQKYSIFNRLMREKKIRPISFSKYCFGLVNLEDCLKINNFKPMIRRLEKFKNKLV